MASRVKRTKVGSACQRCRTQKLKCDIQRPCTLCLRVGADCQAGTIDQWRSFQSPSTGSRDRPNSKGKRTTQRRTQQTQDREPSDQRTSSLTEQQPWSSSTMSLVEGAFNFHNSSTPDSSLTTALPGTMRREAERRSGRLPGPNLRAQEFRSTTRNLVSLLPPREVAALLVDTYFDRAHWFTLIFMQEEFRQRWEAMYDSPREQLIDGSSNPAFFSTFLVVIAIALRYTGSYRQRLLRESGIDATSLEEGIVSALRVNMLDIVSLGSLEAVQTCVLLGTHYLYHGRPGLAWPVCGLGLRLAQALNLHRMLPTTEAMTPDMQSQYETRKRCWWAIYEIETFCSMSYGYPHSIKDADCDVELLDPLARTSAGQSPASFSTTHQCPASLLSYKYLMSKLSILIKDALIGLYGIGSFKGGLQNTRSENSAGLRNLIKRVSSLDSRLQNWKMEIPDLLRLDKMENSLNTTYSSVEEMDQDIRANGPGFETHIYQLQALTLELAYQNARILVHRPLLTYKMAPQKETPNETGTGPLRQDPFQESLHACREAALKTAEIGSTPIFSLAAHTFAVTFVSIHTFTAALVLCLLSSIEPLTAHSHASKIGLRQLLNMQRHLKATARSSLASQGLEILERLTKLVMEKELKEMLAGPVNDQPIYSSDEQQQTDQIQNELETAAIQGQAADEEFMFNYDPAMSKALFDFDQALSSYENEVPLEPLFADSLAPGSAFSQEQAWIWGTDNLGQMLEF